MKRFSIGTLMMVVLVCGVAIAALHRASDTWAGVLLSLTMFLLGVAVIGAVYRQNATRAWWFGFALFGWGYLTLSSAPWFADQIRPRLPTTELLTYLHGKLNPDPNISANAIMLTGVSTPAAGNSSYTIQLAPTMSAGNASVKASQVVVAGPSAPPPPSGAAMGAGGPNAGSMTPAAPTQPVLATYVFTLLNGGNLEQFQRVGHDLFTLLAALVGGLTARWFYRSGREPSAA